MAQGQAVNNGNSGGDPMIIHNVAQGTQKWLDLRKGIPTCSRFDEIVAPGEWTELKEGEA